MLRRLSYTCTYSGRRRRPLYILYLHEFVDVRLVRIENPKLKTLLLRLSCAYYYLVQRMMILALTVDDDGVHCTPTLVRARRRRLALTENPKLKTLLGKPYFENPTLYVRRRLKTPNTWLATANQGGGLRGGSERVFGSLPPPSLKRNSPWM